MIGCGHGEDGKELERGAGWGLEEKMQLQVREVSKISRALLPFKLLMRNPYYFCVLQWVDIGELGRFEGGIYMFIICALFLF